MIGSVREALGDFTPFRSPFPVKDTKKLIFFRRPFGSAHRMVKRILPSLSALLRASMWQDFTYEFPISAIVFQGECNKTTKGKIFY
jgi:hypothetical protein